MWTWIPLFLAASFQKAGTDIKLASGIAFTVIAVGGVGSLIAGRLADRMGRTVVTSLSMAVSGFCALVAGLTFGMHPVWTTAICLIWGFFVVADSAQFSAAISELAEPEYTGSALTFQTCLGFLLTLLPIRLIPLMVRGLGWRYAFMILALGPMIGIWAMLKLRRDPLARQLAQGRR
jgi:MFS family permease